MSGSRWARTLGDPGHHGADQRFRIVLSVPFSHTDVLPLGDDTTTEYRCLDLRPGDLVDVPALGRAFLQVPPETLTALVRAAVTTSPPAAAVAPRPAARDHRRPRGVVQRPVRRDRPAAQRLRLRGRRAADVPGHGHGDRHRQAHRDRPDRRERRGGDLPRDLRGLRGAQPALLPDGAADVLGRAEHRHEPARAGRAVQRPGRAPATSSWCMAKGGGSANKTFLYQETKALLNPKRLAAFLDEKLRSLGTAACPPYHLAIVVGGMSAEFTLKVAKLASARYLDRLPTAGSALGPRVPGPRPGAAGAGADPAFGIGAQFGGKYFCHDVRVIRLPRHGASLPVGIAVSCSADRQAKAKITPDGVFLEQLERDPARYLPDVTRRATPAGRRRPDRPEPADGRDPRAALALPVKTRLVADRPAGRGPRHRPREDRGAAGRGRGDAGSTCATTPCTTRARRRRRTGTRRARSGRRRRAGWTPTSSSSRPRAGRW